MNFDVQYQNNEYYDSNGNIDRKSMMKVLRNSTAKFIRNDGQTDNRVKYYAKMDMISFFFAEDRIVFSFLRKRKPEYERERDMFKRLSRISVLQDRAYERLVFTMKFKGASSSVEIQGLDKCEGKVNYFKGNGPKKCHIDIPCFKRIIYKNLYPSIDLVCQFKDASMKYEFIINPGASPNDINLAYSGVDGLNIDKAGNLVIKTPMGDFFDGKPDSYQEINGEKINLHRCRQCLYPLEMLRVLQ